jgi:hypothetical protein
VEGGGGPGGGVRTGGGPGGERGGLEEGKEEGQEEGQEEGPGGGLEEWQDQEAPPSPNLLPNSFLVLSSPFCVSTMMTVQCSSKGCWERGEGVLDLTSAV